MTRRVFLEQHAKDDLADHIEYISADKMLEADGWKQVRMRGSHRQFRHSTRQGLVAVSGKSSSDIPPGTLRSALKQAGLKKPE